MGLVTVVRFQAKAVSVLVLVLCSVKPLTGFTQTLYRDDSCDVNGKPGICKGLSDCPSVLELVNNEMEPGKICSYQGSEQIVCCPKKETPLNPDMFASKSDTSSDDQIEELNLRSRNKCPAPPFEDMKKEGAQYLPWNKCVEFSQQMYSCKHASNSWEYNGTRTCKKKYLGVRIIAGNIAEEKEFPHMALLGYTENKKTTWRAGGTLISELYILTAAHVLDSRESGLVEQVCLGVQDRREINPDATYQVVDRIPHPEYSIFEKCYSDIGLIRLNRAVKFSEQIRPACLPSPPLERYMNNEHNEFVVSGWGVTDPTHTRLSDFLRKATLTEFLPQECVNLSICSNAEEWNDKKLICAGSRKSRADSCQGDSGGPIQVAMQELNCPHAIVGIVSTGQYCGYLGIPASYTRVSHYVDWIVNITWPNNT